MSKKPTLVVNDLVVECHEQRLGVWAVHVGNGELRTYRTGKIAVGVGNRFRNEGRLVHGIYSYSPAEVEDVVVAAGRGHRWSKQ